MEDIPNTFKEAMILPAKAHWKAFSDKEVVRLKKSNVYTAPSCLQPPFQPATRSLTLVGYTRSRWTFLQGASRCVRIGIGTRRRLRRYVCSSLQASKYPYGAGDSGEVRLWVLAA